MMKKVFLFSVLFLILVFRVFSESYSSNIFGQKLGPAEADSVYIIDIEDGIEFLKKNDVVVKKISRKTEKGKTVFTEEDLINGFTVEKTYENGLLKSKTEMAGSNKTETLFNYIDGSLLSCTVTENGSEPITEYFIKDSYKGKLLGKKIFSDTNFSGTDYLIENDSLFRQLSESVVVKDSFDVNEDGNIVYSNDDRQYVYSSSGKILEQNINGIITNFEYDENDEVIKTRTSDGTRITESFYSGGIVTKEYEYENDELNTIRDYTKPFYGMVATIVKSGTEIADVYYDFDHIKILKIEYRN